MGGGLSMSETSIAENLEHVREKIAAAATRGGRQPGDVTLLAVSKTWPAEFVREAVAAGQTAFGENKVQEALAKIPELPGKLEWHLIGHLQKNKVKAALPAFAVIHSIDSLALAERVDRLAEELGLFPKVYLEVNVGEDAAKHGFSVASIRADLDALLDLERLHIQGLMTIPPFDPEAEKARPHFVALRELRDELVERSGIPLPGLSMGMSLDYEIAIQEGATVVRVGTEIFGKRKSLLARQAEEAG